MIVLGNPDFAIGMKLAGIRQSFGIKNREQGVDILREIEKNEFILANVSIMEMLPELENYVNVVTIPDSSESFAEMRDLKELIKSVVGIELEVE